MKMNTKNLAKPIRALVVGMILMCAAARAEERLSVLSWNTEHYAWERRSPAERTLLESNMFAVVRAVQPDVFLMQETYGSFERFKAALPGYDARLLGRCNSIFSRYRLRSSPEITIVRSSGTGVLFPHSHPTMRPCSHVSSWIRAGSSCGET